MVHRYISVTVPAFQKKKKTVSSHYIQPCNVTSPRCATSEAARHVRVQSAARQRTESDIVLSVLWRFGTTDTLVPLIRLSILLRCAGFAPVCRTQHLVAAAGNLMHPHNVHDVQADTGADPSHAASPGHKVEGLSAIDCIHTTVVDWHDGDADHEKDYCHSNAICHVGPGGLGITKYLKEPAET